MNILILGGTHLVGPCLVDALIKEGHAVTLFNRGKTNNHLYPFINKIQGDRRHLNQYKKELQQLAPDIVIDMIAMTESDALQLVDVFSSATEKYIVISSGDVYMAHEKLCASHSDVYEPMPLNEKSTLRKIPFPYRKYAKNSDDIYYFYDKTKVEHIINNTSTNSVILRFPFVYGPRDHSRLLPYLQDMVENKSEIRLDKNKAMWRSTRGYVGDLALAILKAAMDKRQGKFTYNVGEIKTITEKQWVQSIASLMNWTGNIIEKDKHDLPKHLQESFDWQQEIIYDTSKIRQELNYQEITTSELALKTTLDWALENPSFLDQTAK